MEITVLSVPGCPHVGLARRRLAAAIAEAGVKATVTERVVATPSDAAGRGFAGSPTILVEGHDPFPAHGAEAGLACRLYPSDTGPDGAPSVAALTDALRAEATAPKPPWPGDAAAVAGLGERARWAAFDRLVTGQAVSVAELADALGVDIEAAHEAIDTAAEAGLVDLDEAGDVVGAHGLTLAPTPHRLVMGGVTLHTWCALDALGIPAALGADAVVTTPAAGDGPPVTVDVRGGQPVGGSAAVLWLPQGPCEDLRRDFCAQANLHPDADALQEWRHRAGHPPGRATTLGEAARLGRAWWGASGEDGCCRPDTGAGGFEAPWRQLLARQRDMFDVVAAVVRLSDAGARPARATDVSAATGYPVGEVYRLVEAAEAGLASLRIGHADGQVWLDLTATGPPRYWYEVEGRRIGVAGCGPDAFEVAYGLGRPMRVEATCPVTAAPVAVDFGPDGVTNVEPATTVVAVVDLATVPEAAELTDAARVDADACIHQVFFATPDAAQGWLAQHPGGRAIPAADFDQWRRRLRSQPPR